MQTLTIDSEFKALIPPLTDDERRQLEENLLAEGCRDALVTWNGVLIDGHNRYEICTRHGIDFRTVQVEFDSRHDVIVWIVNTQLGRRNLPAFERGRIVLRAKDAIAAKAKENMRAGGEIGAAITHSEVGTIVPTSIERFQTREVLAQKAGVSTATITRIEKIEECATPEVKTALRSGEISIHQAYEETKKQERIAQAQAAREERAKVGEQMARRTDRFQLHHAPCREALTLPRESVDWIITDPPYPREFLGVYDDLAEIAAHVLKPGGSLICMIGQSYLPQIVQSLRAHLTYHWTLAYLTQGGKAAQLFDRSVNSFWKPVLWFTKGDYARHWIGDVAKSDSLEKPDHRWQQSASGMVDLMKRFVKPGDAVMDPFLGSGTTGVVALQLGCSFIGYDVDKQSVDISTLRLTEVASDIAAA